jgi:Zn-dependent peptidase ImmA (M78 family)/transcriptional regulator with XRE-family HTH domain
VAKPTNIAYVSGPVVRWARERAGLSSEELAVQIASVKPSLIEAWERGESLPTFSQAETLSETLRVPLAVFFMEEPPNIALPIPDLRTVSQEARGKPSLEFFDIVSDITLRQRWYREFREEQQAKPLDFVGSFRKNHDVNAVAKDMANRLGIDDQLRQESPTWQNFFVGFVQRAETLGVLVMRSGVVRHNPTRTLAVEEFRGFAISDEIAPLVFINSRDAKAAQIFTLAHELAHIWIGASGISNLKPRARTGERSSEVENFCNQVAAQLLVPGEEFEQFWTPRKGVSDNLRAVATHYRVSMMVALRRAYDLHKINYTLFSRLLDEEYNKLEKLKVKEEDEGGGNFWASFNARNSPTFVRAVLNSIRQDRLSYRDAAVLMGVRVQTLLNHPTIRKPK